VQVEERTVRYSLTRKDIFACHVRAVLHRRAFLAILIILYLAMCWLGSRPVPGRQDPLMTRLIAGTMVGLAALVGLGVAFPIMIGFFIWQAKHKNILGEHELSITDQGLVSKSATGEGLVKWAGLHKVVSTPKYLLIYLNESMVKVVPKRSFLTLEEATAFEQEVRRRMQPD
jgi:hypothetical protein